MSDETAHYGEIGISSLIHTIRDQKVILDADLARVYGVPTKALNQAVKRNAEKFPVDFAFILDHQEVKNIRSQIVTGSQRHRDPTFRPYVFTEHGAIMAATILNSPRAVAMSVFVHNAELARNPIWHSAMRHLSSA